MNNKRNIHEELKKFIVPMSWQVYLGPSFEAAKEIIDEMKTKIAAYEVINFGGNVKCTISEVRLNIRFDDCITSDWQYQVTIIGRSNDYEKQ